MRCIRALSKRCHFDPKTNITFSLYEMIALNEPANIAFGTDLKVQAWLEEDSVIDDP